VQVGAPRVDDRRTDLVTGQRIRFGLSPWTARILFILILLVIPGSQIIVYPILWVLMPSE
jgi:phage shock protein PspC (stress-responsive transcriptional regulator)